MAVLSVTQSDIDAIKAQEPRRIRVTYSTITWGKPNEFGECDYAEDHGFEDAEGVPFVDGEIETAAAQAAKWLRHEGATEASCSCFDEYVWYSASPETNCRTGAETTKSYHLYGFTAAEKRQIWDLVHKKRINAGE